MRHLFGGRRRRLAISVAVLFVTAGGIAYATIPGSGNVYSACMLKSVGTIRLIDPSLPSSNLMSHCTALEAPISWNQQGQTGAAGAPGNAGVSPTVAQLSPGDSHCPAGGAAITDASGSTAFVCSGQNGADGQPFTGTFTSPNGQFSLTVADTGVRDQEPGLDDHPAERRRRQRHEHRNRVGQGRYAQDGCELRERRGGRRPGRERRPRRDALRRARSHNRGRPLRHRPHLR